MTLDDLDGTRWEGGAELWEDPLGDVVQRSDCSVTIEGGALRYTWSYQGQGHHGSVRFLPDGGEFQDSWHQKAPATCRVVHGQRSIACLEYDYATEWGWRIALAHRTPTDELVLQMTNIAPWGEEARAVRMVCRRVAA